MARALGPDFISLQVRDLAVSQRFYTTVLGMEIDPRFPPTPTFVAFRTQPIPFGIQPILPGADLDAPARPGLGVSIWLNCDDVDALFRSLEASGVPIVQPVEDTPFGRRFICRDPDGYTLVIYKATPLNQVRLNP